MKKYTDWSSCDISNQAERLRKNRFSGFLKLTSTKNPKWRPWTIQQAERGTETPPEYTTTPVIRWRTAFTFLHTPYSLVLWSSCDLRGCRVSLLWPLHCFHSLCICSRPAVSIGPSVRGFGSPAHSESTAHSFHSVTSGEICLSVRHCAVCVTVCLCDLVFDSICSQNKKVYRFRHSTGLDLINGLHEFSQMLFLWNIPWFFTDFSWSYERITDETKWFSGFWTRLQL